MALHQIKFCFLVSILYPCLQIMKQQTVYLGPEIKEFIRKL